MQEIESNSSASVIKTDLKRLFCTYLYLFKNKICGFHTYGLFFWQQVYHFLQMRN